jgi:hypothetical protein
MNLLCLLLAAQILATPSWSSLQDEGELSAGDHDLVLDNTDEVLPDRGFTEVFFYAAEREGVLHFSVWSPDDSVSPFLRVTNVDGEILGEDDNSPRVGAARSDP